VAADPVLIDAVAWALFAGEDAYYLGGTHVSTAAERELAAMFVESLAIRGYQVVPTPVT
jgi:hypothetical protein